MTQAVPALEGAGVHLHRAFGFGDPTEFDPFLLLDDLRNERPEPYMAGFPWHPHRGLQPVPAGNQVVAAERDVLIPSPLYSRRYSSIWPTLSDFSSFSGMRIKPSGAVIARETRPVYSPLMSK